MNANILTALYELSDESTATAEAMEAEGAFHGDLILSCTENQIRRSLLG